ncbi:phosphoadenosine phosphosulfate reductase family protein [Novosphingobium sp. ST904]|uniref:phosphoadenosine phosphosulfate reductase domain-containing protein n=1 Tax=Novosphingobium sp. ST904 TaxID=1684385 RepID=UPI0006C88143|nr:phosphoadenosine phosphosulfate reductase family protein [Novosphingobium sp. ST904]KPH68615.1 phosphoadenosine phosphosulfate reductase [Novosphingobium sp. ST904]TCM23039.1 DNA sulfur modification protein DndC [Novosphingobium sp. ST904]
MKPLSIHDVQTEGVELTLQSLRAYWSDHDHFAVAWSGGKDSTALLTVLIHLIDAGLLPQPECLWVFYADTRQELPPIQLAADQIMAKLRLRNWIRVVTVRAPLDKRFMVYILGRGVPPPNNNTLRWCTRQIKVEPMAAALEKALLDVPGKALMLTGVRQGESAIRDGRIAMSCSKDGAECGQGWYQQVLPDAKGIKGRLATLAPLLHWRVCWIWDWLKVYAPMPEFGGWPTQILADAYGGDDAKEINARTGCIGCPLAQRDTALETIVAMPAWAHLTPLLDLKPLYRWMREPKQRLRKAGAERLKSGAIAKNPQRMGPLTLEARSEALERVIDIQSRARVDLINAEEEARIRALIAAGTYPDKWTGDEPRADRWLDAVYGDGTEQPILFRELVGS